MSPAAARRRGRYRRYLCLACGSQRALFRYRGAVRADRDHTLCFRCFRAEVERARARRLREVIAPALKVGFARPVTPARSTDLIACA